jgi:hypothetical protein
MPKIWFFDDNHERGDHLAVLLQDAGTKFALEVRYSVPDAMSVVGEIDDADWVSLDSQMPGPNGCDVHAGLRLAAAIRGRGAKCRLFWHSANDDFQHLFSRLGIEALPYVSLPWLENIFPTVPEGAAEAAVCALRALDSDPFEIFAPFVILLQGCLFAAGLDQGGDDNPICEDLRSQGLWTAAVRGILESDDFRSRQALKWGGWFEPAIKGLRDVEPLLARGGLQQRFALLDEKRALGRFLKIAARQKMFEHLGLPAENPKELHNACVAVLGEAINSLVRGDGGPSRGAACYVALQVLALQHSIGVNAVVKTIRACAHDLDTEIGFAVGPNGIRCTEPLLQGTMTPEDAPMNWARLQSWPFYRAEIHRVAAGATRSVDPLGAGYLALDGMLSGETKRWLFPLSRLCVVGWLRVRDWEQSVDQAVEEFDRALERVRRGGSGAELLGVYDNMLGVLRAF